MIYAAALVPLVIFSQFISPFHFGKVVIFRSLVEIMLVFYLILAVRDRSYRPQWHNPILIIFGLFTFMFAVTTALSVNPYLSFWGSLERMGGFWSFLHYYVFFVILISVFKTKADWLRLLQLSIFVGVLSALYGFGQKTSLSWFVGSGGRERIFGTIGNPSLFAGYQVVNLFMALALALSDWVKPKHKGYLYVAILINLIAIIMTAVRGTILAIAVGLVLMALLATISSGSRRAKQLFVGLFALAIMGVVFAYLIRNTGLVQHSRTLTRLTDVSIHSYTVQTRTWAWRAGLEGWKQSAKTVLFGWGPENFNVPFSQHFDPRFFQGVGSETLFDRAHNMFVEVLVTMGLFTFLVYVGLFAYAMHLIWKRVVKKGDKNTARLGIGLIAMIVAYMIHNSFIFDTSANFIVFFTFLGFISWLTSVPVQAIVPAATKDQKSKLQAASYKLTLGQQTSMVLLLIGAIILVYRTNIRQSLANYAITRAIVTSWAGDINGAINEFHAAMSYDGPGKYEYRNRYGQFLLETLSGKKIGEQEKAVLEDGIAQVKKNADENNDDYLPYLYLSRFYIVLGKSDPASPYNDTALQNSTKAYRIAPKFVRTYYEIAQAYLNKKNLPEAIKWFKQATELNPDVSLSYWYLGITYLENNQVTEGLAALDQARKAGYPFAESDLLRLVNYYLKLNDYNRLAQTYEDLIVLKPDSPQYHASLAVAYGKIGKVDQAIEQAKEAAKLDPSFEKEARSFVQSLGRQW